jgi:DNA-binding CsgD family transcriptional regulator
MIQGSAVTQEPEVVKVYLTEREKDILKLISQEFTNAEIAEKLFISVRTVDAHRRNLLQKIGARNTAGLVVYAIEHKLNLD